VLSLECGTAAVAVDVDFEDRRVMNEAIDGGERQGGIADHCRLPLFRMGRWLGLASLIRIIHSLVNALI